MRDKSLPQSEAGQDGKGVWGRDVEDKTSHTQRQPGRSEELGSLGQTLRNKTLLRGAPYTWSLTLATSSPLTHLTLCRGHPLPTPTTAP